MAAFNTELLVLLLLSTSVFSVCGDSESQSKNDQDLPRYVVFPGLDAGLDEIAEWNVGFASPFNVFFGPKPYILGWAGEAPFAPGDEEDIEEGEIEGEEEIEGEDEEEDPDDEEEEAPEYDYENKLN